MPLYCNIFRKSEFILYLPGLHIEICLKLLRIYYCKEYIFANFVVLEKYKPLKYKLLMYYKNVL